ncbi:hypothetical protein [Rhizobium sp. RU33A]|uniref:hypothetical protein n=1 Tax=Rhizobium sp. RU33A TaxID=1907413 RepID=UPI00158DBAD1|nr:hypothetical protein [Rhizobium sp. RU33A]
MVKTTKSITAEHQEQRSKQTCNDGFEVNALPKRRVMPQVLIIHDHPSEDGCGIFERIFPPGKLKHPLLSDHSSSASVQVDGGALSRACDRDAVHPAFAKVVASDREGEPCAVQIPSPPAFSIASDRDL